MMKISDYDRIQYIARLSRKVQDVKEYCQYCQLVTGLSPEKRGLLEAVEDELKDLQRQVESLLIDDEQ